MLTPQKREASDIVPDINAVLSDVSLEAVMPTAAELHEAASALPTGTSIYLTDLPNRPADKLVAGSERHFHARFETGAAYRCAQRLIGKSAWRLAVSARVVGGREENHADRR